MADTLKIFGVEYTNVTGIIAKDDNSVDQTYIKAIDGNNLEYGYTDGSLPIVGIAKVDSAHVWDDTLSMMIFGTGQIGTGRVV